jgi:hypothetical protein
MHLSMKMSRRIGLALTAAMIAAGLAAAPSPVRAFDLFEAFFGGDSSPPPSPFQRPLGYGREDSMPFPPRPTATIRTRSRSVSAAYCVRTCDGRYFPVTANGDQSRAATCNNLCPASETKVFYGSTIDTATTDGGKSYSSLPNAFKYREQLIAGCTCNGKDSVGLASIAIADDKTIRKGDIVAGEGGLVVANQSASKHRSVANFSPAPERIRAKFARTPVAAID